METSLFIQLHLCQSPRVGMCHIPGVKKKKKTKKKKKKKKNVRQKKKRTCTRSVPGKEMNEPAENDQTVSDGRQRLDNLGASTPPQAPQVDARRQDDSSKMSEENAVDKTSTQRQASATICDDISPDPCVSTAGGTEDTRRPLDNTDRGPGLPNAEYLSESDVYSELYGIPYDILAESSPAE
ncbi:uncharacterized protein LOC144133832 [Amblyomma americanum]